MRGGHSLDSFVRGEKYLNASLSRRRLSNGKFTRAIGHVGCWLLAVGLEENEKVKTSRWEMKEEVSLPLSLSYKRCNDRKYPSLWPNCKQVAVLVVTIAAEQ